MRVLSTLSLVQVLYVYLSCSLWYIVQALYCNVLYWPVVHDGLGHVLDEGDDQLDVGAVGQEVQPEDKGVNNILRNAISEKEKCP